MSEAVDEIDALATRFAKWGPLEFSTSPLYQALSRVVATDRELLELVARRTPGQQPTILFFAAVHHLVLTDGDHPLANFYASVAGDAVSDPADAGPALLDFCRSRREELTSLVTTRRVQTNVAKRSAALRLGLSVVTDEVDAVHLVEVGCSAGINLCHDRYRYRVSGDAVFGDHDASLELTTEWRGPAPLPDLDRVPVMLGRLGVDLHPIDLSSSEDRQWLRALVWPENNHEARTLETALEIVAADPPRLIAGDASEICPGLDAVLPPDEPRVVFHAATRAHVPGERRRSFDEAIAAMGASAPLFVISLEGPRRGEPVYATDVPHHLLKVRAPDGGIRHVAFVEGHADWMQPID